MVNISEIPKNAGGLYQSAKIKIYGIIAATTITALLVGYFFSQNSPIYGAIALVFFLNCFILQTILIDDTQYLVSATIISGIAITAPFYNLFSTYLVVVTAILIIFMLSAVHSGRKALGNMLSINFFRIARLILASMISGIVVFLTAIMILNSGFSISEGKISRIIDVAVAPIARKYIPEFSSDMKVEDVLMNIVLRSAAGDKEFAAFPPNVQKQIMAKSVRGLQGRIEKSLGVGIDPALSVAENVNEFLQLKIGSLTSSAKVLWSIILIGFVLISVKGIEFIIYIPIALLAYLSYELLLSFGLFIIQRESKSRDVILLN